MRTCHIYLPSKFTTAIYHSSLLQLPTVQVCYSYLPIPFSKCRRTREPHKL
ncbi:hypothetical protein [Methanimicrococcus blatticola]|uniref:hypothetical protein n=1 Tax=Methanimicrococcus blatticola TaxID=91560 RepID=UPI001414FC70|nr:hypothetical protein [Methanimicrococcus blatticola]MBZ3935828.1 hypothetical protein [Methanimicrococcus blatticola]MCC2508052.1 hypothetical protein [Methanimicrococcus blatticola]